MRFVSCCLAYNIKYTELFCWSSFSSTLKRLKLLKATICLKKSDETKEQKKRVLAVS